MYNEGARICSRGNHDLVSSGLQLEKAGVREIGSMQQAEHTEPAHVCAQILACGGILGSQLRVAPNIRSRHPEVAPNIRRRDE